jgi:hypothetical protein
LDFAAENGEDDDGDDGCADTARTITVRLDRNKFSLLETISDNQNHEESRMVLVIVLMMMRLRRRFRMGRRWDGME